MTANGHMTPIFRLCDDYVARWAALDPIGAAARGITDVFRATTDYSPDGLQARADLVESTLSALAGLPVSAEPDRLAAAFLRERLEALSRWHQSGEPLRDLKAPLGLIAFIRDSPDLLPRASEQDWRNIAARLAGIGAMFGGWRASLDAGLGQGLAAARRQAVAAADQAERYGRSRTHDALLADYGDGPLRGELAAAADSAYAAYTELARYLRTEYAPRAAAAEGVGAERYAIGARLSLGDDVDLREAYDWGWAELARIEAELAAEAATVKPGASLDEVAAILDQTRYVDGPDAYRAWLQDRHDQAIEELNGRVFDIAGPLRTVEVVLAPGSSSGAPYYTPPSEDLSRPGRTWWPLGGRDRFAVWSELSIVFHEGVPGHHLQNGAVRTAGERLSRFAACTSVSGHGEGWALYAERLADELGWHDQPGTRLGMLGGSALRAARVVIDIGVHLDLPLPDGSRWTFEKACEVLRERGRAEEHRVVPEVTRYFGWPGQAISYKLGERAWLAARATASKRPGFDLKRWHTAALNLGPVGLATLTDELNRIDVGGSGA